MNNGLLYCSDLPTASESPVSQARKSGQLLRLFRVAHPISRTDIIERLRVDKRTVTENFKPLIASGILTE
jgi:DNA-binding MarR family transcriptional regulator